MNHHFVTVSQLNLSNHHFKTDSTRTIAEIILKMIPNSTIFKRILNKQSTTTKKQKKLKQPQHFPNHQKIITTNNQNNYSINLATNLLNNPHIKKIEQHQTKNVNQNYIT